MLKVGDVIYLLDKKSQAMVPCLIIEKVNSVSLQGESTHHMVSTPGGKSLKLEEYKSPWFETIDDAKNFLLDSAKKLIQKSADAALKVAKETFDLPEETHQDLSQDTSRVLEEAQNIPDQVIVDLGDGQTAKVTMPVPVEVP